MISREEAKVILIEMHDSMHDGYMTHLVHGGKRDGTMEGDIEALSVAIEDMQKQIPQKPTIWGDGYANGVLIYDMWDCPNCEKSYEIDYDHYDHCPNCGQAIDWSDIE